MYRRVLARFDGLRTLCTAANTTPGATTASEACAIDQSSTGAAKLNLTTPSLQTKQQPVYQLPYYGAPHAEVKELSDDAVTAALRLYGGLIRKYDTATVLRERLVAATRADYRPKQLTMEGVVVSDKMDKSVVVASRRRAYEPKLRMKYWRTRRFMAHDELNLCREGDRVVIRSCRPLSKRKAFVVVRNYGDPTTRSAGDDGARACVVTNAARPSSVNPVPRPVDTPDEGVH